VKYINLLNPAGCVSSWDFLGFSEPLTEKSTRDRNKKECFWGVVHSALVRVNEELLDRKVAAPV
jgi:hypothetical protein